MDADHLLNLNPHKTLRCLGGILTPRELEKIRRVLQLNVHQLLQLASIHFSAASRFTGPAAWRQRVSRAYYACYLSSRAVRLAHYGHYDTDPSDHKQIGNLPEAFPRVSIWKDFLVKLRADRNLADYDHTVTETALEMPSLEYLRHARRFLNAARRYLRQRGNVT